MRIARRAGLTASVFALLFACALPASAQTPPQTAAQTAEPAPLAAPLAQQIGTLLTDPRVEGTHWGISVTQLDGTPIYALNDDQLFQPESNVKLFTTAAALGLLKPDSTYSTRFIVDGTVTGTTMQGDIDIEGEDDAFLSDRPTHYVGNAPQSSPTLARLDALAADFAAQLTKVGVTSFEGKIRAWNIWKPYGEGWNNDDLIWGYGAPVSELAINDNQLELTVTAGLSKGDAATISLAPNFPYYTLQNNVVTAAAKTPTYIDIVRNGRTLNVYGVIATDTKSDKEEIAIDDPPLYIALAFKFLLMQHGITVSGDATSQRQLEDGQEDSSSTRMIIRKPMDLSAPIPTGVTDDQICNTPCKRINATHVSSTLLDDVIITNKESLNLHAELILRNLAMHWWPWEGSGINFFAQGSRVVRQFAINAGVQSDDFYFVDGSGLSTDDLATPRAFTQLLRYAATQPWGADYKSSLPIGGVDGTLEDRFIAPPLKGNVFAKTGTSSEDRALSGYLVCASGRTVVFSILAGNRLPGSHDDRDVMDKIVAAIAAAN